MTFGVGIFGSGMHDFVLRECEVGFRVAAEEDAEACGLGPMIDFMLLADEGSRHADT